MPSINTKQYDGIKPLYTPDAAEVCGSHVDIEFPSAAFVANDLIRLATIPAGVRCVDYKVVLPDVDSGGAPAFAWSIGELNAAGTDLATVYASGITTGQAGGVYRAVNSAHFEASAAADRRIAMKITTAAATYAGSGKTGVAVFDLQA